MVTLLHGANFRYRAPQHGAYTLVDRGETATVTYDVMFGESAAYTALTGEITNVDGTWTVSRSEFCSFMASARNACPA